MFDVKVTEEQLRYAADMVERFNFGQRGRGDGNKREQLTGILGQTVFADLINAERPNGATGFDGGKDFEINHKRVDIKTMTRSVPMRPDFVHNFVGYQKAIRSITMCSLRSIKQKRSLPFAAISGKRSSFGGRIISRKGR